jgi:L-fuculose-phosphate aldolase
MARPLEIKEQLANVCNKIYEKDMVCGSGGNISVRVDDAVFITPSGYSLGLIQAEDIVEVSLNGVVKGSLRPSKELFLHLEAYKARQDITAVVHIHSLYSIIVGILATNLSQKPMPSYTPGYTIRVPNITQVPFYVPGSKELAQEVSQNLQICDVVLMKNHGLVTVGKDLQAAFSIAEEVEENAKMHVILKGQGALTEQQVQDILKRYQ